ncbi:hypothetical protein PV797_12930 [Clostridiaceae bacterium M8S5]|nr:hypothetical protein PV797_12930 [Clostridiaceae bacterium M8S5]
MSTKKVILFIVEGITDKTSLGGIIDKLIKNEKIRFYISNGDITSDSSTNTQNAVKKVNEHVKRFLDGYSFNKSDLLQIIHLVDTDGAYISDDSIEVDDVEKFIYSTESITAKSIEQVLERNNRKKQVMNRLASCPVISKISYTMYYFSCNLEHVLHNEINLNDDLKFEYAEKFAEKYYEKESEFIDFINDEKFAVKGNFRETWDFIKNGNNSLRRYTNFHLYFGQAYGEKKTT